MTAIADLLGRYGCPVCLKRFESLQKKKAHMRRKHPKPAR